MKIDEETKTKLEQSESARRSFVEAGLSYSDVNETSINRLITLINRECLEHRNMKMQVCKALKKDIAVKQDGSITIAFIKVKGPYFDKREAISFNNDGFIGFAGWADKFNIKPFVTAFTIWVNELSTPIVTP